MAKHIHPADLAPSCDQLLHIQQDISCHFVDQFVLLPTEPVCGRVVKPVAEFYEQFEIQWKLTH